MLQQRIFEQLLIVNEKLDNLLVFGEKVNKNFLFLDEDINPAFCPFLKNWKNFLNLQV
jgi:hypothetical protein